MPPTAADEQRRLAGLLTRDRTNLFLKHRDAMKNNRRATRGLALQTKEFKVNKSLMAAPSDDECSGCDARVYSVPPAWTSAVDDINADVVRIEQRISELHHLSSQHLLPSFGDDEQEDEERIAETVAEISKLFKECEQRLKEVKTARQDGGGDEMVRQNIERRVAQQLQDLSIEFRRGHKHYLAKLKGQKIDDYAPDLKLGGRPGTSASAGGFAFDDEPSAPECVDPRFSAAQTLQLVMAETMTKEREKAINSVAESVTELAEIFREIQVLVIDQGTVLDRIDFNIEQAADRVGAAVTELKKAEAYQKKSKTMLCIYLLLLLCGAMIIILILKKSV